MTDLASVVTEGRDAIVARFVAEVQRKDLSPPEISRGLLVDDVPAMLDAIALALRRGSAKAEQSGAARTAERHGDQRWQIGYDLKNLILEYGVLRRCVLAAAEDARVVPTVSDFEILADCLNDGLATAASEYSKKRDAEIAAKSAHVEVLAAAGKQLSSSLDSPTIVARLSALIVPALAEWCTIRLGEVVHHVNVAPADLGRLEGAELPLEAHASRFGALKIGGRTFDEQELLLLGDLASRASTALYNARLYEASLEERARVEAATRAKDQFVAMVSHELRTPLHAILGWAKLLREGNLPADKHADAYAVIERNAAAQSQLVADLLDISRVTTGKLRIQPSQVDFRNVVEMAIEGVRTAADAKRIVIEPHLVSEQTMMRGDGDRLLQVVWNLLANAVKFTPKDGRVQVSLRRVSSDLELAVSDSGIGIVPEFLPHVFETFRQAEGGSTRTHGGLGVGLSITKYIVELHGGTISVASDGPRRGATFTVRLPISPLVSTTVGIPRVPRAGDLPGETSPDVPEGMRVLVIDDDADARELVGYLLQLHGIEVRMAPSVAEAMRQLESFSPTVIVSDIGMPEQDGYALIRGVRALPDAKTRQTPAIALTAFATSDDRARALAEGFDRHMIKPVEPAQLIRAVIELASAQSPR